jgi:hopanoid biosynthesis associated protein HpnK
VKRPAQISGAEETPARRLVITADDFGADAAVNEAVEIAHRQGVLTAASLMVGAPGAGDAVARARALPTLRVGLHLVLVEGRPILPAAEVSSLVDGRGRFRDDMARAGATMFFSPKARRQLAAEIAAQFAAFAATGLVLDHVNAHKHFHLHPTIAGLILKIGARHGMKAARVPLEPRAVLAQIEPAAPPPAQPVVDVVAALARRRFARAGVRTPDQVFGLAWSGAMTARRLEGLIAALPPGLSEIYLHPATGGIFEGAAPGYRYAEELAALMDPGVIRAAARPDLRLGGFADL